LATKKFRGYEVFKEISAKYSNWPSRSDIPYHFHDSKFGESLPDFEDSNPMEKLQNEILTFLRSRSDMTLLDIYRNHSEGQPFIKENYKKALLLLHDCKKVRLHNPNGRQVKERGFPDNVIVNLNW
jgi:hypothetical protein